MAYALVGSIGALSVGLVNATVTPAWGAGETPTAGHLLICWVGGQGNGATVTPLTPAGWSIGKQVANANSSSTVFYKIAAGSDAVPSFAAVVNTGWEAQLGEFSGNASSSPVDQSGSNTGTTSTQTATAGAPDVASGELVVYSNSAGYSAGATKVLSATLNNGATPQDTNNNGGAVQGHCDFGYGITTGNAQADTDVFSFTAGPLGATSVIVSFKLAAAGGAAATGILPLLPGA